MPRPAANTLAHPVPAALPAPLTAGHPLPSARTPAATVRWTLALLGLVAFALGAVGALIPGMPTTVFLLIGSYLLTRSCPRLEEWLLSSRLFRPYAAFIRSREPLSPRVRMAALAAMWTSILISAAILMLAGALPLLTGGIIAALGLIGTVAILFFRR